MTKEISMTKLDCRIGMRRSSCHWAFVILGLALSLVAPNSFAADTNAVLDAWFAAQTNLQTWSADFVQTRALKALTRPLVTTGHVWFAVPDRFHWELGRPARTIALGEGDSMFVIYPLLRRAERYPMGETAPKQWRDLMSLLQAGLPRNRAEFESQFRVRSLVGTNGHWRLALQPRSAAARQLMPELRVTLATNNLSLAGTELVFMDGSRMRSDYTNAVLNAPLDKKLFDWQPPPDYKIVEPLKSR